MIEKFLTQAMAFFKDLEQYWIKRKEEADKTGPNGKAGKIRLATSRLLDGALPLIQNVFAAIENKLVGVVKGFLYQAGKAIEIEKRTDEQGHILTEQLIKKMRENDQEVMAFRLESVVQPAHSAQAQSTLLIKSKYDALMESIHGVRTLADIEQTPQESFFNNQALANREAAMAQFGIQFKPEQTAEQASKTSQSDQHLKTSVQI